MARSVMGAPPAASDRAQGKRAQFGSISRTYFSEDPFFVKHGMGNSYSVERRIIVELLKQLSETPQPHLHDADLEIIGRVFSRLSKKYTNSGTPSLVAQLERDAGILLDAPIKLQSASNKTSTFPARKTLRELAVAVDTYLQGRIGDKKKNLKATEDPFKLEFYRDLARLIADSNIPDASIDRFLDLLIVQMGGDVPPVPHAQVPAAPVAVGVRVGVDSDSDSESESDSDGIAEAAAEVVSPVGVGLHLVAAAVPDDDDTDSVGSVDLGVMASPVVVRSVFDPGYFAREWGAEILAKMPRTLLATPQAGAGSGGSDNYLSNQACYQSLVAGLVRYREESYELASAGGVRVQALAALRAELEAQKAQEIAAKDAKISKLTAEKTTLSREKAVLAVELGRTKESLEAAESNFALAARKAEAFPVAVTAFEATMELSRERQSADKFILSEKKNLKERLPFFSEVLGSLFNYMHRDYFVGSAEGIEKTAYLKVFGVGVESAEVQRYQASVRRHFATLKASKNLAHYYTYSMANSSDTSSINEFLAKTFVVCG